MNTPPPTPYTLYCTEIPPPIHAPKSLSTLMKQVKQLSFEKRLLKIQVDNAEIILREANETIMKKDKIIKEYTRLILKYRKALIKHL